MISIKGLSKKYDSLLAVDGVDLEIPKGELFGFLGPNGAAKTTTIKLLVGLLKPTSGSIFIDNIDLERDPIEEKRLWVIFPIAHFFMTNSQVGSIWNLSLAYSPWIWM